MSNWIVLGVVLGVVGAALSIILIVLRDLANDSVPSWDNGSWDDGDWDDLAHRGDRGYYDEPEPPRE